MEGHQPDPELLAHTAVEGLDQLFFGFGHDLITPFGDAESDWLS